MVDKKKTWAATDLIKEIDRLRKENEQLRADNNALRGQVSAASGTSRRCNY